MRNAELKKERKKTTIKINLLRYTHYKKGEEKKKVKKIGGKYQVKKDKKAS